MADEFADLRPGIKIDRETRYLLNKKPKDRGSVWPENHSSAEKVKWTKELAEQALGLTEPRPKDDK